jgi:lysophospholipase L1-like esterase
MFTTNSLGLRDAEIADDVAIRILTMGDSCTWGWGLAQRDAYPQVLQRLMDERGGPGRYRVINGGMPGATAHQGLRFLRARAPELEPAIVIFGYGFNDQLRGMSIEEWMQRVSHNVWLQSADDWLIDYSRVWRWIRWQTQPPPAKPNGVVTPRSSPEDYKRNLTGIVELARARGAKVLMIKFYANGLGKPYAQALTDVSRELAVPLIVYSGPTIDSAHPTEEGARTLAATIYDQLVALGYITTSPPAADNARPSANLSAAAGRAAS